MMWIVLAQASNGPSIADAVPQWVGGLGGSALLGVLFYYVLTKQMPHLQEEFHVTLREERQQFRDALDKERESRERIADKTFVEHKEAIRQIVERDERRHEQLISHIDALPSKFRNLT